MVYPRRRKEGKVPPRRGYLWGIEIFFAETVLPSTVRMAKVIS